ncbi:MAG TPA: nucleotidyltransferase domain-containing protein [Candidatus Polarisedimenticolaceae bacterium]
MSGRPGPEAVAEVRRRLEAIEREEGVVVLLAVESGSRAWGFASDDSDYDTRFLYVRPPDWYLTVDLERRRDVLERPIVDDYDVNGWDLRKALRLFRKSNPPLLEWLQCPIVYAERFSVAQRLRAMIPTHFDPRAGFHHYLHMARGNFREYLRGDEVWRKKYFYVLRPLLAIRWIEAGSGAPPIEFERLVDATVEDPALRRAIDALIAEKRAGAELARAPRVEAISAFVEAELGRHEATEAPRPEVAPPIEELNVLFRETLREVWG